MKGLLKKDFLEAVIGFKALLAVVCLFAFIGVINKDGLIFLIYLVVLPVMLGNSMLTVEEREKWPQFAGALPVSRRLQTVEKYVFSLCMEAIGLLLITVVLLIRKEPEILGTLAVFAMIGLLVPAIAMPITHKFGAEKSRYVYMILVVLTTLAFMSVPQADIRLSISPLLVAAVVAVLYVGSILLSIAIVEKKEY